MTEAKHTPGPWGIIHGNYGCKNIHRIGEYPDGGIFAIQEIGYTHGLSDETEDDANAKLIAAAPDLLSVAKRIDDYPEINLNNYNEVDVIALHQWANDLVVAADAAIAKATGGTN